MNIAKRIAIGAAAMTAVGSAVAGMPASAAPTQVPVERAVYAYHIKNNSFSDGNVYIYSENGCVGSRHTLTPSQTAQSIGWDSFKVTADRFSVTVTDGSNGDYITTRSYSRNACVQAYNANDYLVAVL